MKQWILILLLLPAASSMSTQFYIEEDAEGPYLTPERYGGLDKIGSTMQENPDIFFGWNQTFTTKTDATQSIDGYRPTKVSITAISQDFRANPNELGPSNRFIDVSWTLYIDDKKIHESGNQAPTNNILTQTGQGVSVMEWEVFLNESLGEEMTLEIFASGFQTDFYIASGAKQHYSFIEIPVFSEPEPTDAEENGAALMATHTIPIPPISLAIAAIFMIRKRIA